MMNFRTICRAIKIKFWYLLYCKRPLFLRNLQELRNLQWIRSRKVIQNTFVRLAFLSIFFRFFFKKDDSSKCDSIFSSSLPKCFSLCLHPKIISYLVIFSEISCKQKTLSFLLWLFSHFSKAFSAFRVFFDLGRH